MKMEKNPNKPCLHPTCPDTHCRRPKKEKKWYAIPKRSKKLDTALVLYRKLKNQFLKEHPVCEIPVKGCTHQAIDVHHTKGREGELLTDVRFFKAGCRNCHIWVTVNSKQAIEMGYSVSRHKKAS
jgi:Pyruvate/2-oxoacid:ferredoxin oxidoreductase delta subunit